MKKTIAITSLTGILALSAALPAFADTTPNFGTCLNPQWSQTQVNYGSNHGVINVGNFSGTDTIYSSNGNVMQCLCADNGEGYQTNWLKASGLSWSQIDSLSAQGWTYVPDASAWGLGESAYLAQNNTYTCTTCTPTPTPTDTTPTPTGTVTPTVTPTAGPTVTPTPGPAATPTPVTQVGAAAANNTLAFTGNWLVIFSVFSAGVASLILGVVLRKFSK